MGTALLLLLLISQAIDGGRRFYRVGTWWVERMCLCASSSIMAGDLAALGPGEGTTPDVLSLLLQGSWCWNTQQQPHGDQQCDIRPSYICNILTYQADMTKSGST